MTTDYITGPDLRLLRRAREVPQTRLARAMGISRTRLQTIEGSARITERMQLRYVAALETLSARG